MSIQYVDEGRRHDRSLELAATAVDFDLTNAEASELEAHLISCAACARRAAALRTDASALGRPLQILPSARVDAAVHAAIAGRGVRPQRMVLAVAAILILAALLGAVAVGSQLLRNREPLLTTVPPTPTAPVAVVSPGPSAAVAVISPDPSAPVAIVGDDWEALDFDKNSVGGSIEAIAFAGSDLVGGGRGGCLPVGGEPTACFVSAYTNAPGGSWLRTPDQTGLQVGTAVGTSSPPAGIFDIVAGPAGIVAIGYGDDGKPRVWRSPDGKAWQLATADLATSELARVAAITANETGYVIVGWVRDAAGQRAHAAAWTSSDGTGWARALDNADMDVGPCFQAGEDATCGGMLGVVATPTGLVAVGADHSTARGTEPGRPAAWTSPDGRTWARAFTGLDFTGSLSDVSLGGPGLVAVGTICPPQCFEATAGAVAATSVDGVTWRFRPMTGAVGPQHLASAGGRLFAVSLLNQDVDPRAEVQLWSTGDGVAWQRVAGLPSIPDATFYGGVDIAASGDGLVIAGWLRRGASGESQNFSYSSPAAAAPPEPLPSSSGSPDPSAPIASTPSVSDVRPEVLSSPTSGDATGLAWSLAHTDGRAYGEGIAYGPAGWLHAFSNSYDRPPTFGLSLSNDLKTWSDVTPRGIGAGCISLVASRAAYLSLCSGVARSSDGLTWANVDAPATEGLLKGSVKQLYTDGTTFLATTGGYPADDGIWTSPDGAGWTKVHLPGAAHVIIDAVAGRASGGYLIAGRAGDDAAAFNDARTLPVGNKNPGRQAMWQSTDGVTWTALPLGDVFDGARITGLAVDGPGGGIVAVGHFGEFSPNGRTIPTATVWRSSDGVAWQHLVGPAFDLREGDVGDARVVALPGRWLVFAERPRTVGGQPAITGTGVALGSEDGTAWWSTDPLSLVGPTPYTITGLVVANGRLVALDNTLVDSATVDPSARIWVSP